MQVIGREIWADVAKHQNFKGRNPGLLLGSSSKVSSLRFGISDFTWACGLVNGF